MPVNNFIPYHKLHIHQHMFFFYSLIYCTYTLFANEKQPNKYNKCQELGDKNKKNKKKLQKPAESHPRRWK